MQNRFFIALMSLAFLGSTALLTSCSEDTDNSSESVIGNFVDQSIDGIDRKCKTGHRGCFEFVFPINITFADGTTASPDSYDALKDAVRAWKEANPDVKERPDIDFPIEITTSEGEIVSIASEEELKEVAKDCRPTMRPGRGGFKHCFHLVFPVELTFGDGSTVSVSSKRELKEAVRNWKKDNPDGDRPELVFPVTIEYQDGTTEEVNSAEDIQAAKQACRDAADN